MHGTAASRHPQSQACPARPQIDGQERFVKLVDFLRKKLGREQVVRPHLEALRLLLVTRVDAGGRGQPPLRQGAMPAHAWPWAPLLQFVYLKEAFSPSLDERILVLFDAFGVDGRLVVNYALTPAWG